MQAPTLTGYLIVLVFLLFTVLWFVGRRDERLAREAANREAREEREAADARLERRDAEVRAEREAVEARLERRDAEVKAERFALEARMVKRDEAFTEERRKLDQEARVERKETQDLIRQLGRTSDAMQHAITGLEKTVDRVLSKD